MFLLLFLLLLVLLLLLFLLLLLILLLLLLLTNDDDTVDMNRRDQYGVFHLTESRLEQHNRRYNNGTRSNPTSDKYSTSTTETAPQQGGRPTTKAPSTALQPTTYYDRLSKDDSHQLFYPKVSVTA